MMNLSRIGAGKNSGRGHGVIPTRARQRKLAKAEKICVSHRRQIQFPGWRERLKQEVIDPDRFAWKLLAKSILPLARGGAGQERYYQHILYRILPIGLQSESSESLLHLDEDRRRIKIKSGFREAAGHNQNRMRAVGGGEAYVRTHLARPKWGAVVNRHRDSANIQAGASPSPYASSEAHEEQQNTICDGDVGDVVDEAIGGTAEDQPTVPCCVCDISVT